MRWILLFSYILVGLIAQGQKQIKGKVVSEEGEPLPFVNIGIINTHVGTISELNGDFELTIPAEHRFNSVTISCVGFLKQVIDISSSIGKPLTIVLKEDVAQLEAVVVNERRDRPKIEKVGGMYSDASRFMSDIEYSGSAIAQLIETPFDTTFIHWVSLGYASRLDDLKMRIKFSAVGPDGKPGELLINKDIIVDLPPFDGQNRYDLESQFLFVTTDKFFVQFEPLILKEDRKDLHKVISWALKEHPDVVFFNKRGELIVNSDKVDLSFIKFKVRGRLSKRAYYRSSSFGQWYPSEELTARVGISNGSMPDQENLTKAGILSMFRKKPERNQEEIKATSSVTNYQGDPTWSYGSLADYLKRIGTLTVTGAEDFIKVYVRQTGSSSAQLNNEPIFVVDNVNMGRGYSAVANSVDVNRIKSVRVLNSLTQTAIYGEQGRSGVILITTGQMD